MIEARIRDVIEAFDSQGFHRTGTDVDTASGEWLRGCLAEAGAEAAIDKHPFQRFAPGASFVQWNAQRISGLQLFDSGRTPVEISGQLGPLGSGAEIGLAVATPGGAAPALDAARAGNRHRAIICVTIGGRPGLAPRNAPSFIAPFGPPVLQVSSEYQDQLQTLAGQAASVTFCSPGEIIPTTASNVFGRVPGDDPSLPPVVLMTPRSGWWNCASERGGGIAAWLETARAIAAQPLRRDLILIASTGHELGHWGLERFLESHADVADGAEFWLHLGASIGAALSPRAVAYASDRKLMGVAVDALLAAGGPIVLQAPEGAVPGGESKNIHERGGRYVSFAGGSEVFHLGQDRWPAAVDVAAVAAYCRACEAIVRRADAEFGK